MLDVLQEIVGRAYSGEKGVCTPFHWLKHKGRNVEFANFSRGYSFGDRDFYGARDMV